MRIDKAVPSDAGTYGVTVTNPLGQDHSEAKAGVRKVFMAPSFTQRFTDLQQVSDCELLNKSINSKFCFSYPADKPNSLVEFLVCQIPKFPGLRMDNLLLNQINIILKETGICVVSIYLTAHPKIPEIMLPQQLTKKGPTYARLY